MPSCKLTKRIIDALPSPSTADQIWWDEDLKGFGLKLTPAGRKVFLVQYRPSGKLGNPRKYTIGEYGSVTPHQARIEAQRVLGERAAGRDPQVERQTSKRRIRSEQVAELAAEFIARHAAQNRTGSETARIFNREVLPYWGSWTVGEVRKRDVIALLDRVRERGSPIMANRILAAVRKFFNWCVGRGILELSPCAGITAPVREQARHRVLADEELAHVLNAARQMGFPFGAIVEVLTLTGQRRDEVGRIGWEHLDLERRVWMVPGEHAKNGKPHLVHLSEPVLGLLEAVPRSGELVFSGDGKRMFQGYSKAKAKLDELSGVSDWTLHDLRRTVVSGMARLGVAPHVADKILSHQSGTISGVAAVYQRHEFHKERQDALQLWGKHVSSLRPPRRSQAAGSRHRRREPKRQRAFVAARCGASREAGSCHPGS
jgi:integrase